MLLLFWAFVELAPQETAAEERVDSGDGSKPGALVHHVA